VSPAAVVLRGLVRGYQLLLSPVMGPHCRFSPSCSHYALEALAVHGALRGGWLTLRRLLRCQPFGGFGYDPVPPRRPPAGEISKLRAVAPACCAGHRPSKDAS
jgi:uncharacterized protein